jgi:multidrug efflux pump subunit AcrB
MSGFFGAEPVRIQRGRDDVKVKVRYPLAERRSPADIEAVRIRTATGAEVPIERVARIETGREPAVIHRQDRLRVINVRGDIDTKINTAAEVLAGFRQTDMADFKRAFPRVFVSFEGRQQEGRDALSSLFITYPIAMLTIYLLLAGQFGSYFQPIIIMLAIPFGIVGAVLGHLVLGLSITLLSVFGIVAVSGVVVNDALVLVEFVHIGMREGKGVFQAVFDAGPARFRAIMLTTLTTVAGLLPIIVERSMQAQFLIPMAVAISGGLVIATALNLLVTPSLYLLTSDVRRLLYWARHGLWPTREEVEPELRRREREKDETAPSPLPGESRPEPTD